MQARENHRVDLTGLVMYDPIIPAISGRADRKLRLGLIQFGVTLTKLEGSGRRMPCPNVVVDFFSARQGGVKHDAQFAVHLEQRFE